MNVQDEHLYNGVGAVLIKISEDKSFTAINRLIIQKHLDGLKAFRINNDIAVYLNHSKKPRRSVLGEYIFTFTGKDMQELQNIHKEVTKLYLALVCVQDREICCLPYGQFEFLINRRLRAKRKPEAIYSILVQMLDEKRMRVYVNKPGKKGQFLGSRLIISRTDFPQKIFAS